jgi:hypothetical protein
MLIDVRDLISALQATVEHERDHGGTAYDSGYVDGLERAADIAVIKALGLKCGVEGEPARR